MQYNCHPNLSESEKVDFKYHKDNNHNNLSANIFHKNKQINKNKVNVFENTGFSFSNKLKLTKVKQKLSSEMISIRLMVYIQIPLHVQQIQCT